MPDPISIDPSMLSDDDRANFLKSDDLKDAKQDEAKEADPVEQSKETTLKVPEGKFASPERDSRARRVLGNIEGFEFYRPLDIDAPDALDLYVESPEGEQFTIAKTLIDFNDSSNSYEVDTHKYHYYINRVKEFNKYGDMASIMEAYENDLENYKAEYISKKAERSNLHHIHTGHFDDGENGLDYEYIHQRREGDCILATTLNTMSLNSDGHLPMTILESRAQAIMLRNDRQESYDDIMDNDSHLNTHDFAYLLAELSGRELQTEDLNIDGRNRSEREIKLEILERLNKLADSNYKTMAIGTGNHARAIKDIGNRGYALIDPLNREGVTIVSVEEILNFFAPQCVGKESRDNFFYII